MRADAISEIKLGLALGLLLASMIDAPAAEEIATGRVHAVLELTFQGPPQTPKDAPARDIEFTVRFRHQTSGHEYVVNGFWDGDGQGGATGNVFKVRFTPSQAGQWTLVEVQSNASQLNGRNKGDHITALPSNHPGFWVVDDASPQRRWYRRSNGSHPYIVGNTHYSFLSGYEAGGVTSGHDIAADIAANAQYFKKLRFAPHGDLYPHPTAKPYLDDAGRPTDSGDYSHRPNPAWFHQRVDRAVKTAYDHDLIADLILAGPDRESSRSTLRARHNQRDPTPYLKYIAARYGSYPNVWICLCNEYDGRTPSFKPQQIARFGRIIRQFLPYPTPLSVHPNWSTLWAPEFDTLPPWADHMIIQRKLRTLAPSADVITQARAKPNGDDRAMPVVNDELSYQGAGDKHSEGDTIESHLGTFLGGGYGTTGEKPGEKLGQYFRGKFDPSEHTAADNLKYLRQITDAHITFWRMAPDISIFGNLDPGFRGLSWPNHEYVLGTSKAHRGIKARLPDGQWIVTRHDMIAKTSSVLQGNAKGTFQFDAPASRAVLFHFKKAE